MNGDGLPLIMCYRKYFGDYANENVGVFSKRALDMLTIVLVSCHLVTDRHETTFVLTDRLTGGHLVNMPMRIWGLSSRNGCGTSKCCSVKC